ncbi:MAG TPA: 3-hydroxyacyl-ACP dehydratase FabZ family protein [Acetobacteraceae bacterium]|jgi:3-hydroxyacyl-[acyl-carrier-protein] dehydratase|nr:3-hydroxyacyl-ACP dehydratase FabZ family protein [Acetobacteraceae bacterium]
MRLEYFQMIDRISLLDPEARLARADCRVPDESPVFEGHFPGHPLLPGVLMIETMAQIGGWLVLATLRFDRMPFLVQVKEAKLRAFVIPGQALEAEAKLLHDGSGFAVVAGKISADGKTVAGAEITYRVVPFPNATLKGEMLKTARRIAVPKAFFDAA